MNDCTCVKEMLLSFVYIDAEGERNTHKKSDEEEGDKRERRENGDRGKKRAAGVCSCGGQLRGSSSPLCPSLAPARSLRGSLGS